MADEKFNFSSGEILMKEVYFFCYFFFFLDERTAYMMVSYSVLKKSGKKKWEISSQWNFKFDYVMETETFESR